MKIQCVSCHSVLHVPSALKGKSFKCPRCAGQLFVQLSENVIIKNKSKKQNTLPNWIWLASVPAVLCFLCCGGFGIVAIFTESSSSRVKETQPIIAKNKPKETILKIHSGQLIQSYNNNEIAADQEYRGKVLEVNGLIALIERRNREILIAINEDGNEYSVLGLVYCHINQSDAQVTQLKMKQEVSVQGKCLGRGRNKGLKEVHLGNCLLER